MIALAIVCVVTWAVYYAGYCQGRKHQKNVNYLDKQIDYLNGNLAGIKRASELLNEAVKPK